VNQPAMRRALFISGIAVGAIILVAGIVVVYAFFNLSSIITSNQKRILARVSNELGRRVEVAQIRAHMGLGVSIEVSGLKIADDPAFSVKPFVAADEVSVEVEFLPLIGGEAKVTRLKLIEPKIRIIRNVSGVLNIESIGASAADARPSSKPRTWKRSSLAELSIKALSVEGGAIYYNDLAEKAAPIKIHSLGFDLTNFSAVAAFDVAMRMAFSGDQQDFQASGKLGPLLRQGVLDSSGIPVDLKFSLDSILLDRIRALTDLGAEIPAALSIPDPVSVSGTFQGSLAKIAYAMSTDLTAARVMYTGFFNKPAGTGMTLKANGTWTDQFEIASANLKLADLELTASRFSVGGPEPLSAQIDSNSFSLANLGPMLPPAAGYGLAGTSEIHGSAKLDNGNPVFDATVTLKQVALNLGLSASSGITDLNGTIRLTPGREVIEPTSFTIGSAHASLQGQFDSVSPLNASYTFKADSMKLSELFPSRPGSDAINQLVINGTAGGELAAPLLSARIISTDGSLENASYRNLDLTAAYKDTRVSARSLNIDAFGGSIDADADAVLGSSPSFNATLKMRNLNVEQALRSQNIGAADTVHGFLTGNVTVVGTGATWILIKPTLRGSGRLALANGKLVGVNIVADAINAVASAPGVSQLVGVAFRSSHRGMLVDPDTELQAANMSFQLAGPRFTTHDLFAQSPDYKITGAGWFDMDKNIDMNADIQLSLGLEVAIPVSVTGKLPGVRVLPDVPRLAERVAMGAINTPGNIVRGGVNAVGSLIGGGSSGGTTSSSIPNPINAFKKLIP
jgi:uncharacterized protein involved in outer membrane biogenesis